MKSNTDEDSENIHRLGMNSNSIEFKQFTQQKFKLNFHQDQVNQVIWNTGKWQSQLLSIDQGGYLHIYDVIKEQKQKVKASSSWLKAIDVDKSEGKKVALGTLDNKILIYDINNLSKEGKELIQSKPTQELHGHSGAVQCVNFLSSNYLIAGSADSHVSLWNIESKQYLNMWSKHQGNVECMHSFEMDPNIFLTGSDDVTCKMWDIRIPKPVQITFKGHDSAITSVKFMPGNDPVNFASGSVDYNIFVYDIRFNNQILSKLKDDKNMDRINKIAFSKSGRFIFAASEKDHIKVWDLLGNNQKTSCYIPIQNETKDKPNEIKKENGIKSLDISADGWAMAFCGGTQKSDIGYMY